MVIDHGQTWALGMPAIPLLVCNALPVRYTSRYDHEPQSGTTIDEIASGIYRISTPVDIPAIPGGFSFNQYLLVDDEPLLFHSGLRRMFPLVREAVSAVMPAEKLRHVGFSHFEADESGAMNDSWQSRRKPRRFRATSAPWCR